MVKEITTFLITYIETAPVNFLVVLIASIIAMKVFNWTWKHLFRLVIIYILLTFVGQMFGFRVPTYVEIFEYIKQFGDWLIGLFSR